MSIFVLQKLYLDSQGNLFQLVMCKLRFKSSKMIFLYWVVWRTLSIFDREAIVDVTPDSGFALFIFKRAQARVLQPPKKLSKMIQQLGKTSKWRKYLWRNNNKRE